MSKDKYDVKFCQCGRVHFIENSTLHKICDTQDNSLLLVCNNCGKSVLFWLTILSPTSKCWNSCAIRDEEVEPDNIGLIVFSSGEKIFMKSGGYATCKSNSTFIDWDTDENSCSREDRCIVDVEKTIRMISNDEKLDALSNFGVSINWKGTKFEKKFHV